jgi:hypothetical protein
MDRGTVRPLAPSTLPRFAVRVVLGIALVIPSGCGGGNAPAPLPAHGAPAAGTPAGRSVNAVVVMNGCTHLGKDNAKVAESAIGKLVDGCATYHGPAVRFVARLLPGGAIEFVPRAGASDAIPICVLKHPLKHSVKLDRACTLDVQLEEASVVLTRPDGGS